jgi:hypothetical protein
MAAPSGSLLSHDLTKRTVLSAVTWLATPAPLVPEQRRPPGL